MYGDIIGMAGGFFYNVYVMGVNKILYIRTTVHYFELWDIAGGLIKAAFFGVIIALIGCWQGLRTAGGAKGVGKATTKTVVIASISILIVNFFLSKALPSI
jgi:phospholipid/cholesterol/gamma-HCH transport system permease protein